MSQDPLTEKLVRAAGNVARLSEFLAARRSWTVTDDVRQVVDRFNDAAAAVDCRLRELIGRCGAEPFAPDRQEVGQRPVADLAGEKMERFTAFLCDLDSWLAAQPAPAADPAGVEALRSMQASLEVAIEVVTALAGAAPDPAADVAAAPVAAPEEPPPEVPHESSEPAPGARPEDRRSPAAVPDDAPRQLVLDDTDERPMVQEFRNMKELTPDCKEQVNGFLAAWGITHNSYQRNKFLERLLRWITSAPDGQVLVLKVNTWREPVEPYPAYVARDLLSRTAAEPDA